MPRNVYDLSHYSFMVGRMGRLQTLTRLPIIAGDSFELDVQGVFRMSPLRRNLTVDAHVDLFAFFVPHRHIYGDDWINFMKQGTDETVTFDTINVGANQMHYVASGAATGVIPKHLTHGYVEIWNRYFRAPTDDAAILADTFVETTSNGKLFGALCGRQKVIWSTGIDGETDAADREVATPGDLLDILDLDRIRARYKSETQREWFSQRYTDLLEDIFGGFANADADERPTLIMRKKKLLSGYDVDGTDSASLGTYSGKSAGVCDMYIPRKFFPEHGNLWIMALVRFPTIHEEEVHYLDKKSQPTYLEIAGDPQLLENEPPLNHTVADFFDSGSAVDLGKHPYAQWYRTHPSHVHRLYDALNGFTFVNVTPTSLSNARYHQDTDYDDAFQTTQLGQWQAQVNVGVRAHRSIPSVLQSIFAGASNK